MPVPTFRPSISGLAAALALPMMACAAAAGQSASRIADEWWQRSWTFQSERYDVRTDMDRPVATALARHMDVMFNNYAKLFSSQKPRRELKLQLLLFDKSPEYMATLDARFNAKPQGTAGICVQERSRVTLAVWKEYRSVEQLNRTLQHEGFHQFARALFPDIPAWADEGLAELCEAALLSGDRVIFGEVDRGHLELLRRAAASNSLIPLSKLFRISKDDWVDQVNAGEGSLEYAQAWSVVHYLLYGEGGRHQPAFEQFMSTMNSGQSWETAFYRAFGSRDYDALQQRWSASIAQLRPTDLRETFRRMDFLAAGLMALHEKKIRPRTIDELRTSLRELGFSHPCTMFDPAVTLKASDDRVFAVPLNEGEKPEAVFELKDQPVSPAAPSKPEPRGGKTAKSSPKSAPAAASPPPPAMPPMVVTSGLEPVHLEIAWRIDPKTGELVYDILSK